jgi:Toprim-like
MNRNDDDLLSAAQINALDIVAFLDTLGYSATRVSFPHHWYLSPLRQEKTASFKVNRKLNAWWDFGIQQGGNLVKFLSLYYACPIQEVPLHFSASLPLRIVPPFQPANKSIEDNAIRNLTIVPLFNHSLLRYLSGRRIAQSVAQKFCQQARYSVRQREYYAIAFSNRSGGYELRNEYFKGSSSPKDVTLITGGNSTLCVFEGFIDFLSYQTALRGLPLPSRDYLILNTVGFLAACQDVITSYASVLLFLDNDPSGTEATATATRWSDVIIDQRPLYSRYKDVNEWLCHVGSGPLLVAIASG